MSATWILGSRDSEPGVKTLILDAKSLNRVLTPSWPQRSGEFRHVRRRLWRASSNKAGSRPDVITSAADHG
jgi:hypothetical protein